jgi:hypothetical protein
MLDALNNVPGNDSFGDMCRYVRLLYTATRENI